jgi:VWFA-related protein
VTRLGAAALASVLLAQAQPSPTFRSGIDVVRLDVTVLDRGRRPVTDLTEQDFTVLADGRPQPIVAFERVVLPPPVPATAAWMREIAPDVRSNALGEPRLLVILMDDATTPTEPLMVKTAKSVADRVIDEMQPSDLAAVVFTLDNRYAQDFTSDRQLLRAAVEHFSFGISGNPLAARYSQTTLRDAVSFLHQRPHGRKAVILLSANPPGDNEVRTALDETPLAASARVFDVLQNTADLQEIADAAHDAPVPIYGFNIAGLVGPNAHPPAGADAPTFAERPYTDATGQGANDRLRILADMSGGRAVVDDNEPALQVPAVLEEMSAYYTIGYRATCPLSDGASHRVHVTVARAGANVQAADRTLMSPKSKPRVLTLASPLAGALGELLPRPDLPMAITAAPFVLPAAARSKGPDTAVLTTLRVRRAAPESRLTDAVEVLAKVFTVEGKEVASVRQHAALKLRPADSDAQVDILTAIPLKPGHYNLRLSAHSDDVDKTGSVFTDVVVPEFAKDRLSMSGVLMSASPSPAAAPAEAFARIVPVVPTSDRAFGATDRASAFMRVYQRAGRPAPIDVIIHIVDWKSGDAAASTVRLDASRFTHDAGADVAYDLPLKTLPPGSYVLAIRAVLDAKTSVERNVRFAVR